MKADNYDNKDGYKLSLTKQERELVLEQLDDRNDEFAWVLSAYCGIRRQAISEVRFKDIVQRDVGDYVVRVYEDNEKNDEYRETPIPETHAIRIKTTQEADDGLDSDDYVVQHSMRTVARHLSDVGNRLSDEDEMFQYLGLHDGRRTFINTMLDSNVQELQVMEWSGHDDWRTFRDHYLTDFSEEHQSEELEKVEWV